MWIDILGEMHRRPAWLLALLVGVVAAAFCTLCCNMQCAKRHDISMRVSLPRIPTAADTAPPARHPKCRLALQPMYPAASLDSVRPSSHGSSAGPLHLYGQATESVVPPPVKPPRPIHWRQKTRAAVDRQEHEARAVHVHGW